MPMLSRSVRSAGKRHSHGGYAGGADVPDRPVACQGCAGQRLCASGWGVGSRRRSNREDLGRALTWDESRQRGEPGTVGRLIPHPADVPPQYRVLMPENQQLSILRQLTAERQDDQAEHPARKHVDNLEQHPAS